MNRRTMKRPTPRTLAALLVAVLAATTWAVPGFAAEAPEVTTAPTTAAQTTTVLLVRHAERQGQEDALSPLGEARAEALAHVAAAAGVDAVYHAATGRTRETARPLAERLGITPVEHPPLAVGPLAERIRAENAGQVVLVVGHSNTVPAIVEALGGPAMPDLGHDAYDDLFVVTLGTDGTANALHLQFGAETP